MELDYEDMVRIQLEVTNQNLTESPWDNAAEAAFRKDVVDWLKEVAAAGGQPDIPAETVG
jgi:hypothetical protein